MCFSGFFYSDVYILLFMSETEMCIPPPTNVKFGQGS